MILLFLFIVVPAVELALLIEIGERVGTLWTIAIIIGTGMLGARLARQQGFAVLRRMQEDSAAGRVPADALQDGVLLLIAGALLVTPGVLTDVVGFLCLVPAFRRVLKDALQRQMEAGVRSGRIHVMPMGFPPGGVRPGGPRHPGPIPGAPSRRPPTAAGPGASHPPIDVSPVDDPDYGDR